MTSRSKRIRIVKDFRSDYAEKVLYRLRDVQDQMRSLRVLLHEVHPSESTRVLDIRHRFKVIKQTLRDAETESNSPRKAELRNDVEVAFFDLRVGEALGELYAKTNSDPWDANWDLQLLEAMMKLADPIRDLERMFPEL